MEGMMEGMRMGMGRSGEEDVGGCFVENQMPEQKRESKRGKNA